MDTQTPQQELFYDDELHALRSMIENGLGYKRTAGHLWPDMKPESGYARLKNCVLRPEKGEALKFGEILAAMKFNGRFDPIFHLCDETSHHRPAFRDMAEERLDLQGRAERLLDELKRITARQEKLATADMPTMRRVG